MRKLLLLLAVCLIMSGCQPVLPAQLPYKIFLPVAVNGYPSKKGVAMYPGSPCQDLRVVCASWQYSWWPQPTECDGIEDVPMVSCAEDALKLINGVGLHIDGDSDWFMLFNEPDHILPISPGEGAILYNRLLPVIGYRKVVAPAPSELNIDWLPQFRQAYHNIYGEWPRLDALAAHCYKPTAVLCQALVEQFIIWADEWDVPEIWVTEFAFVDLTEARRFIAWMEAESKITHYAWFTNRLPTMHASDAPLVDWDTGRLTVWGQMYSGR